jgi:hypothetical protein
VRERKLEKVRSLCCDARGWRRWKKKRREEEIVLHDRPVSSWYLVTKLFFFSLSPAAPVPHAHHCGLQTCTHV